MLLPTLLLSWLVLVVPSTTPVTLLSGFLGAGKTSCLSHLLSNPDGLRLGVVVNDMAKLNIDAALISNVAGSDESVVKLQNGCACCSLSEELNMALCKLSATGEYDQLIVELSGVANPETAKANLKKALIADDELGVSLDRVVTLIDCSTFLAYFDKDVLLAQQPELRELRADNAPIDKCSDRKAVPQLLMNQVEGADVLVVNKLDLVSPNEQALVEKLLRAFNPDAMLEATEFGKLPSATLVSTLAQAVAQRSARTSLALDQMRSAETSSTVAPAMMRPSAVPSAIKRGKFMPAAPADSVVDSLGISSFIYSARSPL